jgi:microcompartment protein CcmK/EutM
MVIGQVVLKRTYPTLRRGRFLITRPLERKHLYARTVPTDGEAVIVFDEIAARDGCLIAFTEAGCAPAPFGSQKAPIDAYNSCILDDYTMTYHDKETK